MSDNYEEYVRHVVELYESTKRANEKGDKELARRRKNVFHEAVRVPQYLLDPCECVKIYDALLTAITGTSLADKEEEE